MQGRTKQVMIGLGCFAGLSACGHLVDAATAKPTVVKITQPTKETVRTHTVTKTLRVAAPACLTAAHYADLLVANASQLEAKEGALDDLLTKAGSDIGNSEQAAISADLNALHGIQAAAVDPTFNISSATFLYQKAVKECKNSGH